MLAERKTIVRRLRGLALAVLFSITLAFCFLPFAFAQGKEVQAWTLRECWRYPTANLDSSTAASDGVNLYFGEKGGRVTAVAADDGKRIWTSEVGGEISSNLVVADRELQLVTRSANGLYELRSLSVVSGIANRSTSLPIRDRVRIFASSGQLIIASSGGVLVAVEPKAGKVKWTRPLGAGSRVLNSEADALIATLDDGHVIFVDPADGRTTHTVLMKFEPTALLRLGNHLIFGDDRGNITNLEIDKNSPIWTFKSGGKISGIYEVDGSQLLVTSFDNFTYLLSRETGHVVWKRRQPSRVIDAAIVNSRYAGVTPLGESSVLFFDPETGKSLGQVVAANSVEFIQPAQRVGDSVVTFTTEGLISTGFFGCKRNDKAEAETSAFK